MRFFYVVIVVIEGSPNIRAVCFDQGSDRTLPRSHSLPCVPTLYHVVFPYSTAYFYTLPCVLALYHMFPFSTTSCSRTLPCVCKLYRVFPHCYVYVFCSAAQKLSKFSTVAGQRRKQKAGKDSAGRSHTVSM